MLDKDIQADLSLLLSPDSSLEREICQAAKSGDRKALERLQRVHPDKYEACKRRLITRIKRVYNL